MKKYSDSPTEDIAAMGLSEKPSMADFVERVKSGKAKPNEVFDLGKITDRARDDIERLTGQKLNANKHVISATEIAHIWNRHGKNGQADQSMSSIKDFEDIYEVLSSYDSIELSKEKSHFRNAQGDKAPVIIYRKSLGGKSQLVAEAVTDGKKGQLRVITAYKS